MPDELGVEFRMALVEGVQPVSQTDVVSRPVAKAAADFLPSLLDLLGVQVELLSPLRSTDRRIFSFCPFVVLNSLHNGFGWFNGASVMTSLSGFVGRPNDKAASH